MTTDLSIQEVNQRLTANAFAHLEKALSEFPGEINFSLLHFYDGVELVVKSCLLHKDWKLVVQKQSEADWSKFCAGKQKTVGLAEASQRLARSCDAPMPQSALDVFAALREHRNQLTHFFHPSLDQSLDKQKVAGELLLAWFHLRGIIRSSDWTVVFASESTRTAAIDLHLQGLREYFSTVFERQVRPMPGSSKFGKCPSCGYVALDANTSDLYLDSRCHVCGYTEQSHQAIKDGGERDTAGHCLACGGEDCVETNSYGAHCTECDETFTQITTCEFCQTSFAGDEDPDAGSYQDGCSFCTGKLGYLMSKDD